MFTHIDYRPGLRTHIPERIHSESAVKGSWSGLGASEDIAVPCIELLKGEFFPGAVFNPFHYSLAAYCGIVWDVVVHTACGFGTINSAGVHIASFVDVHIVGIVRVVNKVGPRYQFVIGGHGEVFEPALGLHSSVGAFSVIVSAWMIAAIIAVASLYESVMIDVLVTQLSETVSARLVMNKSLEIVRLGVGADRTAGYCGTVTVHHRHSFVAGSVHQQDCKALGQVH